MNKKNIFVFASIMISVSVLVVSPAIEAGKGKYIIMSAKKLAKLTWDASAPLRKGSIEAIKGVVEGKGEDWAKASVKYILSAGVASAESSERDGSVTVVTGSENDLDESTKYVQDMPPSTDELSERDGSVTVVTGPENDLDESTKYVQDMPLSTDESSERDGSDTAVSSPEKGLGELTQVRTAKGVQSKTFSTKANLVAFSVLTTPKSSSIKVMNIKPKYRQGMELVPGSYDVMVSAEGFRSKRLWVNVSANTNTFKISLSPQSEKVPFIVQTAPSSAMVKIMNIERRYEDNIELSPGLYDIQVSAEGYRTRRVWLEVDEKYNAVQVTLTKKGGLACNPTFERVGHPDSNQYNQKLKITQFLPNVFLDELYFSYAESVDEANTWAAIRSGIGDNYAYFDLIQPTHLSMDEIKRNVRVEINDDRHVSIYAGMEVAPNGVKLIEYVELPKEVRLDGGDREMQEAFCFRIAKL